MLVLGVVVVVLVVVVIVIVVVITGKITVKTVNKTRIKDKTPVLYGTGGSTWAVQRTP